MSIRSKPSDDNYRANFDRIFGPGRKKTSTEAFLGVSRRCSYPGCKMPDGHQGAHLVGAVDVDDHPQAD